MSKAILSVYSPTARIPLSVRVRTNKKMVILMLECSCGDMLTSFNWISLDKEEKNKCEK